jgi:hypothetical protein
MLNSENGYLETSLGLTLYALGMAFYFYLFASSVWNYDKNRSYSVGGLFIIGLYSILTVSALLIESLEITLLPTPKMNLLEFSEVYFSLFGIIASCALIFFFLMSGVRMLLERLL